MNIDWAALALVACATVVAAITIVGLFSLGVAALTAGHLPGSETGQGEIASHRRSSANLLTACGYACIGTSGLFVLYGLYLIIPQFH